MDAKQRREARKAGRRAALVEAFPFDDVEGPEAQAFVAAWEARAPSAEERAEFEAEKSEELARLRAPLDLSPKFIGSCGR